MSGRSSAIDTLIQSNLWREFEKAARDKRRRPLELLADGLLILSKHKKGSPYLTALSATLAAQVTVKMMLSTS